MVFSSHLFIFYFLPVVLLLYYSCPQRGKHLLLTIMSYIFYGWANPYFVFLMMGSTVIDYICGLVISQQYGKKNIDDYELLEKGGARSKAQKWAMIISIISNLSLLGFFKYFNFGVENYNYLMSVMGMEGFDTFWRITLPLGISFYTFQSMSYSIDIYRGEARPIKNFTDFSCYVAMFPQLVAGPIVRFQEVSEQLRERSHTAEKFARGIAFLSLGLAKKVLLANPCGKIADSVFDSGSMMFLDAWYGVSAYAFQIYFDFSAYSDMAIGLGLFFGFVFPKNFDSPYHSKSITEFWRRWHLSLSNWLRDYLYIPLGGNQKGHGRTYVNLGLVMLLGGLWHGSSWNFIIWGAIHGGMLAFERLQGRDSFYKSLPSICRVAITFVIVLFAWVFFRAPDLPTASNYILSMFGLGSTQEATGLIGGLIYQPYYLFSFILAAGVIWFSPQTWDFTRRLTPMRATWCIAIFVFSLLILTTQSFNPFIYFIF